MQTLTRTNLLERPEIPQLDTERPRKYSFGRIEILLHTPKHTQFESVAQN